jgi:hypothetical protein
VHEVKALIGAKPQKSICTNPLPIRNLQAFGYHSELSNIIIPLSFIFFIAVSTHGKRTAPSITMTSKFIFLVNIIPFF